METKLPPSPIEVREGVKGAVVVGGGNITKNTEPSLITEATPEGSGASKIHQQAKQQNQQRHIGRAMVHRPGDEAGPHPTSK